MKKVFTFLISIALIALTFCFTACGDSSPTRGPYPELTISVFDVDLDEFDADEANEDKDIPEPIFYHKTHNTLREEIPGLTVGKNYYLRVHEYRPLQSYFTHSYGWPTFVYDENDFTVIERSDKYSGEKFIVKGLRECENTRLKITASTDLKDETIKFEVELYLTFTAAEN